MNDDIICPVCAKGELFERTREITVNDEDRTMMTHVYSVCDMCGSEVVNVKQSIINRKRYVAALGYYEQF